MTDADEEFSPGFRERVARTCLAPIIGILLRCGMSFAEFSKIARNLYVDVASREFGRGGKRANKSRVAMLTGLSRTRVKQEMESVAAPGIAQGEKDKVRPAARVLLGWHTDKRFVDSLGNPRELTGERFHELYESYSGKVVPMTAMLKELLNVGAMEMTEDGMLRVLTRSFTPQRTDPAGVRRVSLAIGDLAATASHNLFADSNEQRRFERFATNQLIPADQADDFRAFLEKEGQAFLERIDDWMTQREQDNNEGDLIRIGAGVYQIAPRRQEE